MLRQNCKVRFHLAKGKNFGKWQVRRPDGTVDYYDPEATTLVFHSVRNMIRPAGAQKIYEGANKDVCAWLEVENVFAIDLPNSVSRVSAELSFNPRVNPNWMLNGREQNPREFRSGFTKGRRVFVDI